MTTRTINARMGLSLVLGLLVLTCGAQLAHAAPKRLGVVTFRGVGEGATRNVVTRQGKLHRYQVVGGQQIAKTAAKLNLKLNNDDAFAAVARELGISAFVSGDVSKKKAALAVRNGADGAIAAEASWVGANPRKVASAVGKTFWKRLGGAIARGQAPSSSKPAPVVAEEPEAPETGADDASDSKKSKTVAAADSSDDDSSSRKSSKRKDSDSESETTVSEKSEPEEPSTPSELEALILSVGPRFVNRSLAYTDNINGDVGNYSLPAGPHLALNADLFPLAFSQSGFLSNIGLTGGLSYMLPVVKATSAMAPGKYNTYALDWNVGIKVRFPVGAYLTLALGDARWQLNRPTAASPDILPMFDYRYLRIGGGGRFRVTESVSLMANIAYLHALAFGQIANRSYFPRTTGFGAEVGAGVGYRVSSLFEVQGGVDFRQFGLAFNVRKSDYDASVANGAPIKVAGGAADRYITFYLALAVTLGGSGTAHASGGGDDSASAKSDDAGEEKKDDEKKDEEEE